MAVVILASPQVVGKLPAAVAALMGVAAFVAVVTPGSWPLVRAIDVIAHEGAHALTGSCVGRRVERVLLRADGNGRTRLSGTSVASAIAGYLGPSGFGVAAAALIAHGQIVAVLWIGVVLLAILLPSVRNVFGLALVIGTGFLLYSVARSGQAWLEQVTAYGLSWLLLFTGVRSVLDLRPLLKPRTDGTDAHSLRDITQLPRMLWYGLWLIGTLVALLFGGTLLV